MLAARHDDDDEYIRNSYDRMLRIGITSTVRLKVSKGSTDCFCSITVLASEVWCSD